MPKKLKMSKVRARKSSGAFKRLRNKLARRGVKDPEGTAANIGRKALGKRAFQKRALAGRKAAKQRRRRAYTGK